MHVWIVDHLLLVVLMHLGVIKVSIQRTQRPFTISFTKILYVVVAWFCAVCWLLLTYILILFLCVIDDCMQGIFVAATISIND